MADLSITAANVVLVDGQTYDGTAGVAITAGQSCYLDTSTNKLRLAQADGTSDEATFRGIALHAAAANQPLKIQISGRINPGATVAVGQVYAVSAAAGGIAPYADLVSTNRVSLIGVGTSASEIYMSPFNSGVQKA